MIEHFLFSAFPELFSYSYLATSIFRVSVGYLWLSNYRSAMPATRGLHALIGILLILGALTQPAAIVATVLALYLWINYSPIKQQSDFWFLMAVANLLLLFTGPGPLAFDLPI